MAAEGTAQPQTQAPPADRPSADTCLSWGTQTEYKSLYLDVLQDNRAKLSGKILPDDNRNTLTRYSDIPGVRPVPGPHARVCATGYHDIHRFPHNGKPYPPKEEVKGAVPPEYYKGEPRLNNSLMCQDIIAGFSSMHPNALQTTRSTNPLVPNYQMATVTPYVPPIPKFIRDSIQVHDIMARPEGSRQLFTTNAVIRPTSLVVHDIEGTTPRQRTHTRRGQSDIPPEERAPGASGYDDSFQTKRLPWRFEESSRHTNPLDPAYRYNMPPGAPPNWVYGPVEGLKSDRFFSGCKYVDTPGRRGDITYRANMLITSDIEGATSDTKGRYIQRTSPFYRTQAGKSVYCADIEGAAPSGPFTLMPSFIRTQRGSLLATQLSATNHPSDQVQSPKSARGDAAFGGTLGGSLNLALPTSARSPKAEPLAAAVKGSPKLSVVNGGTPRGGSPKSARGQGGGTPRSPGISKQLLAALNS